MSAPQGNFLVGVFDDDEVILHATYAVREKGVKVYEVYSPFPVHGIDEALGYKRSRLDIAAFLFGMCGTLTAVTMQSIMLGVDWPMIIGGKPHIAPPSFVPVSFELTVLSAALGMVFTFLLASGLGPLSKKIVFDPRASDDKFIMAIDMGANSQFDAESLSHLLKENGASEVSLKEVA